MWAEIVGQRQVYMAKVRVISHRDDGGINLLISLFEINKCIFQDGELFLLTFFSSQNEVL